MPFKNMSFLSLILQFINYEIKLKKHCFNLVIQKKGSPE